MRKPILNHPCVLLLTCILGSLGAAPVLGQDENPPANATIVDSAPATPSTGQESPVWPLIAMLGGVLGLAGTGLAGYLFMQRGVTKKQIDGLESKIDSLQEIANTVKTIPAQVSNNVRDVICTSLDYPHQGTGGGNLDSSIKLDINGALTQAVANAAWQSAAGYASQEIEPKLQAVEATSSSTRDNLKEFYGRFQVRDGEVNGLLTEVDRRTVDLEAAFQKLDAETREQLEAFVFNMYNLVFTQSEGDPIVPKLVEGIERYQKLLDDLRDMTPHEMTRLTMREFEEALLKLERHLKTAREILSEAEKVDVEPLPYLDEKDRAKAGALLEEYRKKLRVQTAGVQESLDELRDAVVELSRPLQTLWMGASVEDVDQPERTRQCRALLNEIKSILEAADVEVYEARIGGEIDTRMVTYKFADQSHEPPLIAQKVTKLGLKVEERIEPGAVVVA